MFVTRIEQNKCAKILMFKFVFRNKEHKYFVVYDANNTPIDTVDTLQEAYAIFDSYCFKLIESYWDSMYTWERYGTFEDFVEREMES